MKHRIFCETTEAAEVVASLLRHTNYTRDKNDFTFNYNDALVESIYELLEEDVVIAIVTTEHP